MFALDHTYQYLHPSRLDAPSGRLQLATFTGGEEAHPYFFQGRLARPRRTAAMLRALMHVVQARFHIPAAMLGRIVSLADPVVTCSDERLRFEGFSGCCGVYVRIDLLPRAVHGETFGRGTTNVDFNAPMLSALAMIRPTDDVQVSVGTDRVELDTGRESVVEKQVTLPMRWLKGFLEVQAVQQRMRRVHEIPAAEALRFLRSLPRMNTGRRETWIVPAGRGLRISQCPARDAPRVGGLERLRILEGLVTEAQTVQIHADDVTGASGWTLVYDDSRFHLAISPEVWRGFSGEGQTLEPLASRAHDSLLPQVRAALKWEAVIGLEELTRRVGLERDALQDVLAALGTRGSVGYDLAEAAYFHRELPFDLSQVERLQPRWRDAHKRIAEGKVRLARRGTTVSEAYVAGSGVEHRVRMLPDDARCTCPWFAKHGATRGPCKHILAVRLMLEEEDMDSRRRLMTQALDQRELAASRFHRSV
jgi:hypothetical protein